MGRPPRGQGLPASERLEAAFFDELGRTPFQRLTISAVVRSAGVNRNSFYYHFADLDDLARKAVAHQLNSEIPRLVASGLALDSAQFDGLLSEAVGRGSFNRILAVAGPNSTAELRDVVKAAIADLWLGAFRLERSDLTETELATMQFVLSGSLEVLTKSTALWPSGGGGAPSAVERLRILRTLPIVQASSRIMTRTLEAAAERRQALRQ